jgi:hypothetical protein
MPKDEGKPPYLPFSSFITGLDQLAQAMPNVIGREVFPYHSGVLQGQMLGALRFLDLIDGSGTPKGNTLERLAIEKDVPSRRTHIRSLLKSAYADVLKLDLAKMTPSQLDAAFEGYGVSGDTKKKAKTFFIKAARYAELSVSPLLTRKGRASTSVKKKKASTQKPSTELSTLQSSVAEEGDEVVTSKTVPLKGGATLTVIVRGNLLDVDSGDRELIFKFIDEFKSR